MALAGGGAGRTSVLVFTMPFWTLLLAWPVLHERVQGIQWLAVARALAGLAAGRRAVAVARRSGAEAVGGAVGVRLGVRARSPPSTSSATRDFDALNFIAWQMLVGVLPLTLLPLALDLPRDAWSATYVGCCCAIGALSTALGFLLWIAVLRFLPAGTASLNMFAIPVIALLSSMAIFGERLTTQRMDRHRLHRRRLAVISFRAWLASRRGERLPPEPIPLEGG